MPKTLMSDALKKDLMTGNATILLVDQVSVLTPDTFKDADEMITLKDTLSIVENEPDKTPVQIDQDGGATIENIYTVGETLITGSCPSSAMEVFDYFYAKSVNQPDVTEPIEIKGNKFAVASAYKAEKKQRKVSMCIMSQSGKTAIAYMNVALFAVFNWSNVTTTPSSLNFTGSALGNGDDGSMIILKAE